MTALDQLLGQIFEECDGGIPDDLPFADAAGWDSLKHAELVVAIEARFGVDLSRDDIVEITSKRALRKLLAGKGHDV
jgi:acyl carrier protein